MPIKIPFSPHLADLQPEDASQKFAFSEMTVKLWIGGARWDADTGGNVTLYGADRHPGTMTIRPGDWVRIIGKGMSTLPEDVMSFDVMSFVRNGDTVSHANAEVVIRDTETLLTPTASATASRGVCLTKVRDQM